MTIQLTRATYVSGVLEAAASQHTLDAATEAAFVGNGSATYVGAAPSAAGSVYKAFLNIESGNIAIIDPRDESLLGLIPASYTWAGKPAASASNAGQTIRITDVGKSASGSLWQSDGTIWRPVNGAILLASGSGPVSSPLASYTGGTAGAFTLPGGNPLIPAGLLPVGAKLKGFSILRRHGTNGTATFAMRLGTANAATDPGIQVVATTATDAKDHAIDVSAWITSATTYTTQLWLAPQGTGVSAVTDRTGSINTAADMHLSFDMSAANASDSFDLLAYSLIAEF